MQQHVVTTVFTKDSGENREAKGIKADSRGTEGDENGGFEVSEKSAWS